LEPGSWKYRQAADIKGDLRRVIVFHLVRVETGSMVESQVAEPDLLELTIQEPGERALAASVSTPEAKSTEAPRCIISELRR
jgi:hypothetical protein